MLFHLVIHKDQDSVYGVTVPALEGCFTSGDTLEDAVHNAKEAILFHLEGALEDGSDPVFNNQILDNLKTNQDYLDAILVSIDIDISKYTLKPERFNVSWPKNTLRIVDDYVAKTNDNRSNFLLKAAELYMKKDLHYYLNMINEALVETQEILSTNNYKDCLKKIEDILTEAEKIIIKFEKDCSSVLKNQDDLNRLFYISINFDILRASFFKKYTPNRNLSSIDNKKYEEYLYIIDKFHRPSGITITGSSIIYNTKYYKEIREELEKVTNNIFKQ